MWRAATTISEWIKGEEFSQALMRTRCPEPSAPDFLPIDLQAFFDDYLRGDLITLKMLLTISTTHQPATDLGFLLHKNPDRIQTFPLSFGNAVRVYNMCFKR